MVSCMIPHKIINRNENTIHQTSSQRIQQSVDSNVKMPGTPPHYPGHDLFMLWKLMSVFE